MSLHVDLKSHLESCIAELNLPQNPYFHALCSGQMSKQQFLKSQIEFAPMVHFFSRPMAQVIASVPDPGPRVALVGNLWEEHGRGVMEHVHGRTILTLIDRLGGDSSQIDLSQPSHTARIFNETLRSVSSFEDYRFSAATFAGIERTFVDVSTMIFQSIVDQGWLSADRITHYGLHRKLDMEHAEDFLKVVNHDWNDARSRSLIKDGVQFGSRLFSNTYIGLYNDTIN
ncbi:TenA family transcriptional regulator [Paraburkholderia lacunae]|uniref:Iron-containing redox enzyme family protein n=1 Tax=Paraburkholderia lacunae TaxID=2211104 RepID=A0A370N206_9BURK|nr:iron-containing redox enzyme family protein [Paraburkholderia lacunae]RDJ99655.1 iron-containing redox enzyme family protein [Paraburkholderia lacunae]